MTDSRSNLLRRKLLSTSAGLVVIAGLHGGVTGSAFAQQQSAQTPSALEEIVVTARKRAENLADVPLSITAFSADFLEKTGIENMTDLANQTPGLSFRQAFGRTGTGQGGGSSNRPIMRGQSNVVGIPNMGFFVDGIFVSGNITSYQLDNVERIEVIRGPQAALFGRGTFAGAMNFITRKPDDEMTGKVEATVGQHDHYEVTGYVNGPVVEGKLAAEINARYYEFGGDWVNRATQKKEGGEESSRNFGGKLYFTPADNFDLELNVGWSHDVDGFYGSSYAGTNCDLPNIITTVAGVPQSSNRRRGYWCGEIEIPRTYFARTDILDLLGIDGVNRTTWRSSAKAAYEVNDWALTATGAFNKFRNAQAFESGFELSERAGRPVGLGPTLDRRKDWSVEARIESPRDTRLHGLLGGYYYNEDDRRGYRGQFILPTGLIPLRPTVERLPFVPYGTTPPVVAVVPGVVRYREIQTQNDSAVRNLSVFGLLEFEVTVDLKLTVEGRYQVDKIINDPLIEVITDFDRRTPPALPGTNLLFRNSFKKFLPRATMLYMMNEDWNVFANVAKGNKPGGFNVLPNDADAASRAFFETNYQTFREESAWTYELGVKGANEERTLTLNSSVYWIDWSDQQLSTTFLYTRASPPAATPTTTSGAILNAGRTRIRGLEIDLNAKPADPVDIRFAYSYTDGKIRDFLDAETEDIYDTDGRVGSFDRAGDPNGQARGQKVPYAPTHQLIVSGGYRTTISDDWTGFLRSDLTYESRRYDQVHNLAHTGDSYTLNLRAGVEGEAVTVTLFVNNALDDRTPPFLTRFVDSTRPLRIPSRADPAVIQVTTFRDILTGHPRKREIGLTANYKF
ncbi:MAG: TonB-dependent receptor [Rhodospirillaceae bacterium]|nr:TonB-dependent receptor [Rhodospirillaceae bacterium]